MKKIIFVCENMPGFGGRETVSKNLYRMMKEKYPALDIRFLFIPYRDNSIEINDNWLCGIPFSRIVSSIHNTKLRRIHQAWIFLKLSNNKSQILLFRWIPSVVI